MSSLGNNPSSGCAATAKLPAELFYPICAHVSSRHDLRTLATTSRVLQRSSEAALHRKVVIDSKVSGKRFIQAINQCPRFAPLVRELRFELCSGTRRTECREYWEAIRSILAKLSGLESLVIDDGRDAPLSWSLASLPANCLKTFRCAFILDAGLLSVLRKQTALVELSWTGALVALSSLGTEGDSIDRLRAPHTSSGSDRQHSLPFASDPDESIISIIRQYLPSSALSCLKYLHSESLPLARALVPGRGITHLWVPGASFTASISSSFIYRHITSTPDHDPSASMPSISSENPTIDDPVQSVQLAIPQQDLSSAERSANLCRAIGDFSRSKGPLLSLRMAMDLPRPFLSEVLECISRRLPELRALGFLPSSFLDSSSDEKCLKLISEELLPSPVPYFKHLHTICLWSIPSRQAVSSLESSSDLSALRTLACLHFSPAFEWLCLPLNDDNDNLSGAYYGGIDWNHEVAMDDKGESSRRRLTAVHDPENLLWRDV